MAYKSLVSVLLLCGCGGGEVVKPLPVSPSVVSSEARPFHLEARAGAFVSKRFHARVALPEGRAWRIDDHKSPFLSATHEDTSSQIRLLLFTHRELVSTSRCEAMASERGIPPLSGYAWGDPETVVLGDYRGEVRVGLDRGLRGALVASASHVRRCLLFSFETRVSSAGHERVLAERLAVARERIVKALRADPEGGLGYLRGVELSE